MSRKKMIDITKTPIEEIFNLIEKWTRQGMLQKVQILENIQSAIFYDRQNEIQMTASVIVMLNTHTLTIQLLTSRDGLQVRETRVLTAEELKQACMLISKLERIKEKIKKELEDYLNYLKIKNGTKKQHDTIDIPMMIWDEESTGEIGDVEFKILRQRVKKGEKWR